MRARARCVILFYLVVIACNRVLIISYAHYLQSQKFFTTDLLWWRGLARVMEQKGYIREGDYKVTYSSGKFSFSIHSTELCW